MHLLDLRLERAAVEREQEIALRAPSRRRESARRRFRYRYAALIATLAIGVTRAERLDPDRNGLLGGGRHLDRDDARRVRARRLRDGAARPPKSPSRRRHDARLPQAPRPPPTPTVRFFIPATERRLSSARSDSLFLVPRS